MDKSKYSENQTDDKKYGSSIQNDNSAQAPPSKRTKQSDSGTGVSDTCWARITGNGKNKT